MSPKTDLIGQVQVTQHLHLSKNAQGQLEVYIKGTSEPLGILSDNAMPILECMEKGVYFVAEVLRVQALTVEVSIYHAG